MHMKGGSRILAVVPARSGSKGIADKNMQEVGGVSLIGRTAQVLLHPTLSFLDERMLSTDSAGYAEEGRKHGLSCPFLRPSELSRDDTPALAVIQHAWRGAEEHYE